MDESFSIKVGLKLNLVIYFICTAVREIMKCVHECVHLFKQIGLISFRCFIHLVYVQVHFITLEIAYNVIQQIETHGWQ